MQACEAMRLMASVRGGGLYATSSRMLRAGNYISKASSPRLGSLTLCAHACNCEVAFEQRAPTDGQVAMGPMYLRPALVPKTVDGEAPVMEVPIVAAGRPPWSSVAISYPDALIAMLRASHVDPDDVSWCLGRSESYVSTLASHRRGRSGDLAASMAASIALCCGFVLTVWDPLGPLLEVTPDEGDMPDLRCAREAGLPLDMALATLGSLPYA